MSDSRTRPKRPWLIAIFSGVLIAQAFILPVLGALILLGDNESTINFYGRVVELDEARLELAGLLLVWWIFAVIFGFGFWRRTPWIRNAFMALSCTLFAIGTVYFYEPSEIALYAASLALYAWYLYRKKSVRAYFGDR